MTIQKYPSICNETQERIIISVDVTTKPHRDYREPHNTENIIVGGNPISCGGSDICTIKLNYGSSELSSDELNKCPQISTLITGLRKSRSS